MPLEIENFYGVYLLYSTNPKYLGWTYIGFTVNPNRRVNQHNRGTQAGGARRTHGRGPWEMVLIVHGFPNMISALRFEWAWTKPEISRRLRHVPVKRKTEKRFEYRVRVMCEMLRIGPWNRLPLTIRWLKQQYQIAFSPSCLPPTHMPVEYGPVKSVKVKVASESDDATSQRNKMLKRKSASCNLCSVELQADSNTLCCFNCSSISHTLCLAEHFLSKGFDCQSNASSSHAKPHLLPVGGACPGCDADVLWGDLLRYKHGCYQNLREMSAEEEEEAGSVNDQQDDADDESDCDDDDDDAND